MFLKLVCMILVLNISLIPICASDRSEWVSLGVNLKTDENSRKLINDIAKEFSANQDNYNGRLRSHSFDSWCQHKVEKQNEDSKNRAINYLNSPDCFNNLVIFKLMWHSQAHKDKKQCVSKPFIQGCCQKTLPGELSQETKDFLNQFR